MEKGIKWFLINLSTKAESNCDSSQSITEVRKQNTMLKVYKEKYRTEYSVEIIILSLHKCNCTETSVLQTAFGSLSYPQMGCSVLAEKN